MRGIALRPERRRYVLQHGLISHYRDWRPYRNRIEVELRPLWRRIKPRYAWASTTSLQVVEALAEDQGWDEEDGLGSHDPDVRAYVDLIDATITDLMGLRADGGPVPWAREYVHIDAASRRPIGQAVGPGYADFAKWERVRLTLDVSENRVRLEVEDHDGSVRAGPEIDAGPYLSFTNWEELRRAAHELVDCEIDGLQARFEGTYTSGYVSQLANEQARLPELREALAATPRNRPVHDAATWEALGRLAVEIGLDRPRR